MTRKHIAVVLRSLGQGGVEVHAASVSKYLVESGWRVTVIGLCNSEVSSLFSTLDCKIICLPDQVKQSLGSVFNVIRLSKIFKNINPDVVHLHGIRPIFIGSIAAKISGKGKIIASMHASSELMAMDSGGQISKLRLAASHIMHLVGLILSERYLVVSNNLKKEVREFSEAYLGKKISKRLNKRCVTVYNGIDEKYFSAPLSKSDLKKESFVIGCIARMDQKKGIYYLINAFDNLLKSGLDVKLLLVGGGFSIKDYKNLCIDLNISSRVQFLGYQEDVIPFMDSMDVFVLPSLSEGMGLVLVEAMARRIPVIATNVGGIPEVVRSFETGILVEPRSINELCVAINRMIKDEGQREDMVEKAYIFAKNKFSLDVMMSNLLNVYEGSK